MLPLALMEDILSDKVGSKLGIVGGGKWVRSTILNDRPLSI